MSIDCDNAVFARWNAASLNSSIATLYPGEREAAPDEANMPRANYYSDSDQFESESKSGIIRVKRYTMEVWRATYEAAAENVKTIEGKFLPAESGIAPFSIASATGRLLTTTYVDGGVDKVEDAVFRGFLIFDLRWEKKKSTLT